jgi:hypothetical protein
MKHEPPPPRTGNRAVQMTREQQRRQDMQVQWLQEAVAAQHRSPDDETYDRSTLHIARAPKR